MFKKTFNPIGTLYGCPSLFVAAHLDGCQVVTRESPSGESAFYPGAPWVRRYEIEEFVKLPFHKNWHTVMTKAEVELALIGQLYNRERKEWPNYWELEYPYAVDYQRELGVYTRYNPNTLQNVTGYQAIGHEIVI